MTRRRNVNPLIKRPFFFQGKLYLAHAGRGIRTGVCNSIRVGTAKKELHFVKMKMSNVNQQVKEDLSNIDEKVYRNRKLRRTSFIC